MFFFFQCTVKITNLTINTKYSMCISTKRDGEKGEGPYGPAVEFRTPCIGKTLVVFVLYVIV